MIDERIFCRHIRKNILIGEKAFLHEQSAEGHGTPKVIIGDDIYKKAEAIEEKSHGHQ